jgi:hypothetical protein
LKNKFLKVICLAGVIGILGTSLSGCANNGEDAITNVSSIKIKGGSIATNYELNDVPNYDNLAIVVTTLDGKTQEMTWKSNKTTITHSEIVTNAAGKFSFTVTYTPSEGNEFTDSLDYNVLKPFVDEVSAIKIKEGTITNEYWEGETVSYDNLAITVTKTTGTFDLLYKDNKDTISFENMNTTTAGTFDFVVSYTPVAGSVFKDTLKYTVKTDTISKIAIKEGSIATKYSRDETPDYDNLTIQVTRLSGVKELKAADNATKITHTDIVTSALGSFDFTVTYTPVAGTSFEAKISYEVVEKFENTINNIAIKNESIKTTYWTDATPNYDTLAIIINKNSGASQELLWKDNQTSITHTLINTAVATTSADFTVTYHSDAEDKDFTATIQYVVNQDVIEGITIKDGFLQASYILNDTVDYSTLTIIVTRSSGDTEMKWADNKTTITHTDIDTSSLGNDRTFTVTYTPNASITKSASLTYDVIEKQDTYQPTNWAPNETYQSFTNKRNAATDAKDGSNNFIKGEANKPFTIANYNAVDLLPKIKAIDPSNGQVVYITKLSTAKVSVSLSKTSDGSSLNIADYVESGDITNLTSKGIVNFKNNLGELEREVTLTFTSTLGNLKTPIAYKLKIVDGYNISNAQDMLLIDNSKYKQTGYADFKARRDAVLPGGINFDNFVFLKDVTIEKSDLPAEYLYTASEVVGGATGANAKLIGTLKDDIYLYNHDYDATSASNSFNLYGNYFGVTLGTTFPYIFVEWQGTSLPESTNNSIDSHAALFADQGDINVKKSVYGDYSMNFFDFQAYGNQGVSTSQLSDPNDKTSLKQGGILFTKAFADMSYNNCIITHFFTVQVNSGYTGEYRFPITTVNDTRIRDCFSTMMFNYGDSKTVVNNSELTKAGGPLFINQCNEWTTDTWKGTAESDRLGSYIVVDSLTKLENWVTGQGGWFDIYGASSAISSIKAMNDSLFNIAPYKVNFFSAYENNSTDMRMNMIAINMNSNAEGAEAISPNLIGGTSIGGVDYISYEGDKAKMDADWTTAATGGSAAAFTEDLYSTHYGNQYTSQMNGNPIFVTHGTKTDFFTSDGKTYLKNTKGFITSPTDPTSSDYDLTDDNKADGYLGMYYYFLGNHQGLDITDSATATVTKYKSYLGAATFGIVFGNYGKIK